MHFRGAAPLRDAAFIALTDSSVRSDGVEGLLAGRTTLYTSGAGGLAAPLLPGNPALPSSRYPWASSVNGMVQTPAGETWTIGDLGVVRLKTADLARAFAKPGAPVVTLAYPTEIAARVAETVAAAGGVLLANASGDVAPLRRARRGGVDAALAGSPRPGETKRARTACTFSDSTIVEEKP